MPCSDEPSIGDTSLAMLGISTQACLAIVIIFSVFETSASRACVSSTSGSLGTRALATVPGESVVSGMPTTVATLALMFRVY